MTRPSPKSLPSKKDEGSAALDFVLVAVPMVLMALGVIAVCLSAFLLGVIRDSAVEGARFAALADQSTSSGCSRAQSLLSKSLSKALISEISCSAKQVADVDYETVRIQLSMPLIGLVKLNKWLFAESSAPRENQ